MMKKHIFLSISLIVLLLSACSPGAASTEPSAPASPPPIASQPTMARPEPTLEAVTQSAPSEATVPPVATSRGPELHATDPTTVSLASGGLHFVEFFRFT
jgi:hypothetical protein